MDEAAPEAESDSAATKPLSEEMASAVANDDTEEIQRLIEAGEDVDAVQSHSGNGTALHKAAWRDHARATARLLKLGADINKRNGNGFTPLMRAAHYGSTNSAKVLLEHGADTTLRAGSGDPSLRSIMETALEIAERRGSSEVVKLINEAETDRWLQQAQDYGHMSKEMETATTRGDVEQIKKLVAAGAHANACSESAPGRTALHAAAEKNQAAAVRTLLESALF